MKDCFEMSPTCVTGFYPKPLRDFHMNMGLPPPNINWQYPQMYQGEAKSPSDRRDSGIHSSSEGPVSSPSSDESERYPNHQSPHSPYSYPHNYRIHNAVNSPRSSLPDLPNLMNDDTDNDETGESPSPRLDSSNDTSALKSLEMSVEKNLNISSSESFEKDRISENNNDEYGNHEDYSVPSVNSHGKIKVVKCKQCQLVFNTKLEFWTHQREHIKPDRLLQCEKCPFVTEYKHHLEYHMRNHGGEKPFQCQSCDYKCVNKSMLNSHMKSHSNIYQYRCASCQYSSKYCHSLKLHLRKYNHQPAMVLNPDGTPNPLPIIDVYGTRRGPKVKSTNGEEEQLMSSPKRTRIENPIPTMPSMPAVPQAHPGMPMMPLSLMAQNPEMHQNAFQLMLQQAFLMQTFQNLRMMNQGSGFVNPLSPINKPAETKEECQSNEEDSVLDLSPNKDSNKEVAEKRDYKMETPSTTDDEDDERMKLLYNVKVEHDVDDTPAEEQNSPTPSAESMLPAVESLRCPHCCITFDDIALFTIHMRFHNFMDPFTCNSCGQKCENKIEFTVHIFSRPH